MSIVSYVLIDLAEPESIHQAVDRLDFLAVEESITSTCKAGDGNMNLVVRVTTNHRSFVLKQSRPWVEKFPQIEAPEERILAELDFYRRVSEVPALAAGMPRLLDHNSERRIMIVEDLGAASDFTNLYRSQSAKDYPLQQAVKWLAGLHDITLSQDDIQTIGNQQLRKLNHAHIFDIPLQSPAAIDLDAVCDGLNQVAETYQADRALADAAAQLGDYYLHATDLSDERRQSGCCLLHGDFYPGSWLRTTNGIRFIDPEFCFAGAPEFDLAVLTAHYLFCGGEPSSIESITRSYREARREPPQLNHSLLHGWIGIELLRRILGVAQLPLTADLNQRSEWLALARNLVLHGSVE